MNKYTKMLFIIFAGLILIAIIVVAISAVMKQQQSKIQTNQNQQAVETANTNAALQSYYDSYKDPFVTQIRTTLDIYLKDPTSLSSLLVEKSVGPENAKEGLDSFSSDYYKGKFVVIDIRNSVAGGKFIDILFLDKPDKVFLVWVYKLENGEYEMRAIAENPYYTQEKIDYYYKQYPQLFNDRSHSF